VSLLDGRRAVVTGGASGIGNAVARRFAAEGAQGVALDLPAPAAAWNPPPGWRAAPVDVRDEDSIAEALAGVGGIDILVAAAGIVPSWASVAELDMAEFDEVLAVNTRGVAATLKHAAPRLLDGAAVVMIASLNSWRGDPNLASYVASKHAVLGIARSAALELGRRGIRVNAVAPGPVATEALLERMRRRAAAGGLSVEQALARAAEATALGRIATVDDVAGATLFLASDLSAGVTGHLLPVDGGLA
jgi:NAD(P)-dependent dehydrogenase (short-subunit alcohol dehydrogenase family)